MKGKLTIAYPKEILGTSEYNSSPFTYLSASSEIR